MELDTILYLTGTAALAGGLMTYINGVFNVTIAHSTQHPDELYMREGTSFFKFLNYVNHLPVKEIFVDAVKTPEDFDKKHRDNLSLYFTNQKSE
jgi:predicted ATPase|tara:strand:+ start:190 stop:471 length:282 start_codon:yes stop_codon:yes gene_type:complete